MRAAVMRDGALVVDSVPDPTPDANGVVLRTLACGICGSDLHTLAHPDSMAEIGGPLAFDSKRDLVLGHEYCGELTERSGDLAAGTPVCAVPLLKQGDRLHSIGFSNSVNGAYAEYFAVMRDLLLPVPNGLPVAHAALTEPMAVGVHAVARARLTPEDVPLVIGCGPVGLAVIAALKLAGAGPILAADFSPARRELALRMGADEVLDPAVHGPYERFAELAAVTRDGRQVPENPLTGLPELRPGVFFECVGVPGVLDQMMVGATRDCRFVVVGVCMEPDTIRPLLAINKELNLQFVLGYSVEEYAATLSHIAEGRMDVAPLVTGRVDLDGVAGAFRDLADPEHHCKILVDPFGETAP